MMEERKMDLKPVTITNAGEAQLPNAAESAAPYGGIVIEGEVDTPDSEALSSADYYEGVAIPLTPASYVGGAWAVKSNVWLTTTEDVPLPSKPKGNDPSSMAVDGRITGLSPDIQW